MQEFHVENGIAFLFVCIAYKGYWGEMEPIYLMHLAKKLQLPFIGFHGWGEIGPLENTGACLLHNQTITLAVLSERRENNAIK